MNRPSIHAFKAVLLVLAMICAPQWAQADYDFDCSRIDLDREVDWLSPGATREVTVTWVLVVGPETRNLRPTNIEVDGVMPYQTAQRLRQAVADMRCNAETRRRSAGRDAINVEYGLRTKVTFRSAPSRSSAPASAATTEPASLPAAVEPDAPAEDFNPIEQRVQLRVSIGEESIVDKECRISATGDQLGFPMSAKSGQAFVTPRTLTSNILIASCEVLPYITLSQSIMRDRQTGLFPSIIEISVSSDEFESLQASSAAEIQKLEQELAAEMASRRRAAERARIEAEERRQREQEEEREREAERQVREAQLAQERAEAQRLATIMNDALNLLRSAQQPLLEFFQTSGRWPVALTGSESFGQLLDQYASEYAFNLRLSQSSTTPFASAIVSVTLYNSDIEGNLSLAYDDRTEQWSCFSTDITKEVLPNNCGDQKPDFPAPTSVFDF